MNWKKLTKEEKSWVLYDWANSAYSLVIVTAILPIYFKYVAGNHGISDSVSTAYWGYAASIGTLIVSICSPLLGTLGDYKGFKKKLFSIFALGGIVMTAGLALVGDANWLLLLSIYTLSHIGFQAANLFYDGFLVDVTTDERMDSVSSFGFALGYIGSALLFIGVVALQLTDGFGLLSGSLVTKVVFVITAIWWLVFSIPFFKNVHQKYFVEDQKNPLKESFLRILITLKDIAQYKEIVYFLIAYFFYIDGVDTIFTMASTFGIDMGIDSSMLIVLILVINILASPFTLLYGRLAERFGGKQMILVSIFVYIIICIMALFMQTVIEFWIIGFLIATSQGGIQALSRSYFAKLVPKDKANEFFGFYNIFGKFSAILGPVIFAFTTQLTGKSQYGIASLIVLFLVGGFMFFKMKETAVA